MIRQCIAVRKWFEIVANLYVLIENGQNARAFLCFVTYFVFCLVSSRTGPLPLQMRGNNINWECPDKMRETRTETHLKKCNVEIEMGNKI